MNIALSTVGIILGVLPGIIFWNSYLSGRFSRQIFGASTVSELARYIVLAVPLNATAIAIIGKDARVISLTTVLQILTGPSGDLGPLVANIRTNWQFNVIAYLLLLAGAYAAGNLARRVVWSLRLDARLPALRMKHSWFYLLQGRFPGTPRQVLPYADVLVSHPGEGSRLYRGLVTSFEPSQTGEIKELILQDAQRGKGRGAEFKWMDIPGRRLILLGPTIHSINMRYVYVAPPKTKGRRFAYEVKALARSFLFDEP